MQCYGHDSALDLSFSSKRRRLFPHGGRKVIQGWGWKAARAAWCWFRYRPWLPSQNLGVSISLFSSVSRLAKGIVDTNSCRKYLEVLMLFVSVVWEEQKGPPHLLPLPLCCARLGGSAVNRCHVENSQGEVSPPAPASLQVDPGQSQN